MIKAAPEIAKAPPLPADIDALADRLRLLGHPDLADALPRIVAGAAKAVIQNFAQSKVIMTVLSDTLCTDPQGRVWTRGGTVLGTMNGNGNGS